MVRVWKGAVLVCGEPGTGKSYWVREEAAAAHARLFRWNVRTDRSLREGREILHTQVRSKERLFVWIEGADDLTQEAQAFLRRILETAAPNVTCILEVREMWKLNPPILSRCTVISMKRDTSLRLARNTQKAIQLGILKVNPPPNTYTWRDIPALRASASDPYELFFSMAEREGFSTASRTALTEAYRAIGAGSSPWIQLANYQMRKEQIQECALTK